MIARAGYLRLEEGALVGGFLGIVECVLAAATGRMPRTDLLWIWAFDVALGMITGAVAAAVTAMLRDRVPAWIASASIVATPSVLLVLRGVSTPIALALIGTPFVALRLVGLPRTAFARARFAAVACISLSVTTIALGTHLLDSRGTLRAMSTFAFVVMAGILYWRVAASAKGIVGAPMLALSAGLAVGGAQAFVTEPRDVTTVPATSGGQQGRPNVLLVTLDTARRDHFSCYGYSRNTSPSLDEFARAATLYTSGYATSPYTLSSHASLFTGLLPSAHGARPIPYSLAEDAGPGNVPLADQHTTLAQVLAAQGYDTAAIVANYGYLRPAMGLARGFASFDATAGRIHGHVPLLVSFLFRLGPALSPRLFLGWTKASREADTITSTAIEWIRRPRARPYFLFLNYFDAHAPYAPPPEYARNFSRRPGFLTQLYWNRDRELNDQDWGFLIDQYDGSLAFIDGELGRLFAFLRSAHQFDDMLIVVTSDHGEFLGEHGLRGHGLALYEPVLRIPMIVKLPGQRMGTLEPRLTTLADLHWIIRESVTERHAPASEATTRIVAEYWIPWSEKRHHAKFVRAPVWRASYSGALKLIEAASLRPQLFDVSTDPDELRDLFANPARAEEGRAIASRLPPLDERPATGRLKPDPEAEQRLRALGYVR